MKRARLEFWVWPFLKLPQRLLDNPFERPPTSPTQPEEATEREMENYQQLSIFFLLFNCYNKNDGKETPKLGFANGN